MKRTLAVLFALMLVLSGCLGGDDVIDNEEPVEPLLDTDGDGTPDIDDDDDDNDSWADLDELNCGSDSLLASSTPTDTDGDGTCDIRDSDKDGDGWSNIDEEACDSDPVLASDSPSDTDEDGTCDAMDDDIDGDGVANDDDFAPEDPNKSEGKGGCTDSTAFNYDDTAEVDDASCFTLQDAEAAIETAFAGVISSQTTGYDDGMVIQSTVIMDMDDEKTNLSIAMLDENGEVLYQTTFVNDGSGFVEVELYLTPDEEGLSPIVEQYKVSDAYYALDMTEGGWSHCEYDGINWYCTDIGMYGEMVYNGESETETYHLYNCANGDTVLLSQVNDGTDDCSDASDEPNIQSDGSEFQCDDGSTIEFYLVNDGSDDCADGSDEDNFITQFTCDNGNTIPGSWVNDEYDDCGDGSDEPVYDMSDYETSVYTCEDGSEVPLSSVNDGMDDCADSTDETPTGGDVSEIFDFECMADGTYIPLSYVNDGQDDCSDGADEPMYDEFQQETSEFYCVNLDPNAQDEFITIMLSEVNDGVIDCDFRQDEAALAGNETESYFGGDDDNGQNGDCTVYDEWMMIPWSWVADGIDDCDDGTDEPAYDGDGNEVSTMMCDDGTEIPLSWANDGEDDCAGGEDETTYSMVVEFTCDDGMTVDFNWVNDGYEDCDDGSDEPTYDLEELTDFECDDGTLIPFSYVNDGSEDCANAEDEPDVQLMEYTVFECASGDEIPLSSVNDGDEDCPAGDDEPTYDPITQNEVSTYTCLYSGETIALSLVNDGGADCEDYSDEPDYYEEDNNVMQCADGSGEVEISYANDGWDDCDDGSDEAQYEMPDDESVFFCADGSEITVSQFNDGAVDCSDGSDERATFLCDDGFDEIDFTYVNDGYEDCYDGSDESSIEDLTIVDCKSPLEGSTVTASQFRDGYSDCISDWEESWDEMEFELASDCEWNGDGIGWMCSDVFFPTDGTYEMWMHTDENGLEMIGLNATLSDGTVMTAMFDASTHAFLMMEETSYDEDGDMEHNVIMSSAYDSTLVDALMVDAALDTHAPPFAVIFDGEPHPVDDGKVFVCDDGEEVPFAYANDGVEDCADGSDEPTYEEEVYTCSDDGSEIPMSWVNDGEEDCTDGSDEPAYDGNGDETSTFSCIYSWVDGDIIPLSYVNDGYTDCGDGTDEEEGYSWEISGFECGDGDEIDLSQVNNGEADCMNGSDEATLGEGHGYGGYAFIVMGIGDWTVGADDDMLEVVFVMCDTFDDASSSFSGDDYLLPSDCGDELARYTMDEIDNGEIVGLMLMFDDDGNPMLYVDEDFELDGWNTVRLSTPDGEYADENPQVQLPAPGIGFALVAMLGAAMLAGRRDE